MHRRQFLGSGAAGLATLLTARAGFAAEAVPASAADPRFLFVFLRGGYDALNFLVPHASSFYYEARPGIAVPRPGTADPAAAAWALDADWALTPTVREPLEPLWRAGQLAFVPFAGTDDVSRSHFETQDHIELGQPQGRNDFSSGFLNRLAGVLGGASALGFTSTLPLALRGPLRLPNMALAEVGKAQVDARQAGLIRAMYKGTTLEPMVRGGFETREELQRDLMVGMNGGMAGEMEAANRAAINTQGFEGEARRVGRVLRERHRIGFIDVGGWDTHVAEGGASGVLANKLGELSRGLAALADALGPAWSRTTVVVLSEFGRTVRENGNRGTDHGHGSVMWVLGGALRGGRVVGEQLPLRADTLFQQRDLPVLNDVRDVMGGLFARMWGLDAARLQTVFPQSRPRDLGLV